MRLPRILAAGATLLTFLAHDAIALTKIEGEYQLMMELRKNFRAFPWDFDSNDGATYTPAQLRIFSQPRPGTEAFLKVEADWNRPNNQTNQPVFQFGEAHLRFRKEIGSGGFDSYLFSRQDRFWTNTYLLNLVNGRGDAQGVRLDTWFHGLNTTLIMADQSSQLDPPNALDTYRQRTGGPINRAPLDSILDQRRMRTDDLYIARVRRDFLDQEKLRVGLTFNRYESWTGRDSVNGAGQWNSVLGYDGRLRIHDVDVLLEYAEAYPAQGDTNNSELTLFKRPTGVRFSDRAVLQGEIRTLRLGTRRLGYINVAPGWWSRGPLWRNSLGGPNSDETGFNIQSYYLLPERAVTYSNQILWYGNKVYSRRNVREIYNELYIEFVKGFTGKTSYRRVDEFTVQRNRRVREAHLSWFNEVQVESRLAWLRIQSKLRDIGRTDRKQLFVIEERINLTDKTKIYNRFSLGNDASILRKGIFTQLQFRPTANMEMFLQYGPDDIGGGSTPVDDGNLGGSGDQSDIFKLILKGTF